MRLPKTSKFLKENILFSYDERNKKFMGKGAINELLFHLPDYLEIFYLYEKKGINEFGLGGSRMSGKTYFIVLFIIFSMIKNKHVSWIVYMGERSDNVLRTMRETENIIQIISDNYGPGFSDLGEKKNGTDRKMWEFSMYGHVQEIIFLGEQDLHKGTITPPPNTFYLGMWGEEITGTEERGGVNNERSERLQDGVNRTKGSIIRYAKKFGVEDILSFYSFNPYNAENVLLKDYMDYHENKIESNGKAEQLYKTGYCSTIRPETKQAFITTNRIMTMKYGVIPYSLEENFFEPTRIKNPSIYYTDGLGRTGQSVDACYADVLRFIYSYQDEVLIPSAYDKFKLGIDIGYGMAPTYVVLLGRKYVSSTGLFVGENLDGIAFNKSKEQATIDLASISFNIIKKIKSGENKFANMKRQEIYIITDNDPTFQKIFTQVYKQFEKLGSALYGTYQLRLFKEKYQKNYINAIRPQLIKPLLTYEMVKLYQDRDEELFRQIKGEVYEKERFTKGKSKRIKDVVLGDDDARQAFEMAIYSEIPFLNDQLKKNSIIIKDLNYFLENEKEV